MANILIVEDDIHISELVKRNLSLVGHCCTQCYDGNEVEKLLEEHKFDLILLDVMLPGVSGFKCMDFIKDVPVIFVTAKGELCDKLKGLSLGAEDYIVKPFEMLELIARVNIVLKRNNSNQNVVEIGDVKIYILKREVLKGGKAVYLTPQEFNLLDVLITNKNIALSREKLLELAWGYGFEGESKTVDVHIQKLRKKLEFQDVIKTVNKLGYRLEA